MKLDWVFDWEEAAASQIAHKEPPKNSKSDNMIVTSKQENNSGLLIRIDALDQSKSVKREDIGKKGFQAKGR